MTDTVLPVVVPLLLVASCIQTLFAAAPPAGPPPTPEQLHHLIESLGDANYFVRQKAESDLGKLGFDALDALTAAAEHDNLEVAARATRLLHAIRSDWTITGEPPQVSRLLADYDAQEEPGREARISLLIELPENQGAAAVCRIICHERWLPLSKKAALRLIESKEKVEVKTELAATLQKILGNCRRNPARWILAWLQARRNPQSLSQFWAQLVAEEEFVFSRQPRDSSAEIVADLLRFQIAALRKTDHPSDAAKCAEKLISLHRSEPDELARLLEWLIAQADWPATRIMESRCQASIAESPDLLYLLAEAQSRRGDPDAARQSADQALKLNPGSEPSSLVPHLQEGESLQDRGRSDWAALEWESVTQKAPPQSGLAIEAAHLLSELYHDLDDDRRAAETLGRIETAFAGTCDEMTLPGQEASALAILGSLRARREYFDACHWKSTGDVARQRDALDRALATPGYDIEVLIDCYKLPNAAPAYRAKIRKMIEKQLCELREQAADIGSNPAAAQPCNEFAWLVANTEGDLDEAMRFSHRSLELSGGRGSYWDTLARVCFAKGEYARAVKYQTHAAEQLPHNRFVQKQFVLFQQKAKEMGIPIDKIEKMPKAVVPTGKAPWYKDRSTPADENPFGN